MTKKRRQILITSISVLCVVTVLCFAFWFFPLPRFVSFQNSQDEVVRTSTDDFLPRPDEIVCRVEGKIIQLKSAEIDDVYSAFGRLMSEYEYTDEVATSYSELTRIRFQLENPSMEFRYHQRHEYVGDQILPYRTFEYDAILMIFWSGAMIVVPYRGLSYEGIGLPCLQFYNGTFEFKNFLQEL